MVILSIFGNVLVIKNKRTVWTGWIPMKARHRNDGKTQSVVHRNDNVS